MITGNIEHDSFWGSLTSVMFDPRRTSGTAADVENIFSLLGLKPGMQILDLCCGIGRWALEFARHGLRVTGVDLTKAYLDHAAQQAEAENLEVQWVQSDMRDFKSPDTFDVVMNLDSSFGFFDDPQEDLKVLKNMYDSLKPGGKILMDMKGKEIVARHITPRDWYREQESGRIIIKERLVTKNWEKIDLRWVVVNDDKQENFRILIRLYSAVELCHILVQSGFSNPEVYGDYTGTDYDYDARRLVVTADKQ